MAFVSSNTTNSTSSTNEAVNNAYGVSTAHTQGIKREFSVARTPQHNGIAKRKSKTLIEAPRTMALVIKPQNKTPYELIHGRPPQIDFMKPFGCPITILNTKDHLRKFDGKANKGFFVEYSMVIVAEKQTNGIEGTKDNIVEGQAEKKKKPEQEYILIPVCTTDPLISQGPKDSAVDARKKK
nr:ribonuclease H-like domain-containing protein [Tanacetum cinerariifolium]